MNKRDIVKQQSDFILYTSNDGDVNVEVALKDENLWLTQKATSGLFEVKVPAISKHLANIYEIVPYNPISRKMIELNIPRDTAIFLSKKYFNDVGRHEEDLEKVIITKLYEITNELDYWIRIQIEMLLLKKVG